MERQLGKFRIDRDILDKAPELAQQVFSECVPVRAEMKYADNCIHYTAMSKQFQKISGTEEPPLYEAVFDSGEFRGFQRRDLAVGGTK